MALIALDLMSNQMTGAALSKTGKILFQETVSLENLEGHAVSLLIQNEIKKITNRFENKPLQINGIGIAVPGIYHSKSGTVWAPNISGWQNYPLKKDLNYIFAEQKILVKIASKRTCDILGEKWLGAAKKTKNAIFLSIGSGIGAGVLIDGKILHGFNDGVGAAGWLALTRPFKEEYSSRGCLEYLASRKGILNCAREAMLKNPNFGRTLKQKDINKLNINDVFEAYENKDPLAQKVMKEAIEIWGMTAANLISLFNPEIIIFGGTLFGPALRFLDEIKAEAEKWAQPLFMENVHFVSSKLGANAGLYGAGHLAMKKF